MHLSFSVTVQPSLPHDVLLRIASYIRFAAPAGSHPQSREFSTLMEVCSTFLHIGLLQRYEVVRLGASDRSLQLLRHIWYVARLLGHGRVQIADLRLPGSASPLIITRVQRLDLDFDLDCAPHAFRYYKGKKEPVSPTVFARQLLDAIPNLSQIRALTIHWGHVYKPSGNGRPAPYHAKPSADLAVYQRTLPQLWKLLAPRLQVFRASVYVDAVPVFATLDGRLASELQEIGFSVLGGV
jgi:hypothetical protein